MLRRLGFRRLLPALQVVIYLSLIGPYSYRVYKMTSQSTVPGFHVVPVQEGYEFHPAYVDGPTPLRVQFAVILNLPVALTAGVALIPVVPRETIGSVVWMGCLTPFVALLWYGVGLWIDQRLGWALRKLRAPSKRRRVAWRMAFSLSAGLLFGVVALLAIVCAKAIGATNRPRLGEFALVYFPVIFWSIFFFLVCRQNLRESRLPAA